MDIKKLKKGDSVVLLKTSTLLKKRAIEHVKTFKNLPYRSTKTDVYILKSMLDNWDDKLKVEAIFESSNRITGTFNNKDYYACDIDWIKKIV